MWVFLNSSMLFKNLWTKHETNGACVIHNLPQRGMNYSSPCVNRLSLNSDNSDIKSVDSQATSKKLSKAKMLLAIARLNDGSSGMLLNYIYLLCSRCDDAVLNIPLFSKTWAAKWNVNQRPNSSGLYRSVLSSKTARRGKRKRRFTSWKPPNKRKLVSWPDFHICVG